jgi:hypothetical protein
VLKTPLYTTIPRVNFPVAGVLLAVLAFWLIVAMLLLSPRAQAQTTSSNAGASSGSSSVAGAGAQSGSAAVVNQTWNAPPRLDQTLTYGGRYTTSATIRNTPDAHAPAILGGANPCVVGASAGGSAAGFGLSIGLSRNDPGCERRNLAVLAHQMGQPALAQEILCGADEVRAARQRIGQPCLGDQAPPAVMTATPVNVPMSQQVVEVPRESNATTRVASSARPDWCYTATAAERAARPQCR